MKQLREIWHSLIWAKRTELPFIIFASFLITFAISRLTVRLVYAGFLPSNLFLIVKGTHIHHYNYGFALLAISGFWSLINRKRSRLPFIATLYGIGLGLTMDEFGMFLLLQDDYYVRLSYDAVMIVGSLLVSVAYFPAFWRDVGKHLKRSFKRLK